MNEQMTERTNSVERPPNTMRYPALFSPADEGGFTVTFRDIPEAITEGDTLEEARAAAADALLTAMDFYFEDRRTVPKASKLKSGEELVELPASAWAKILLLNEMIEKKVRPSDLARLLDISPQEVNRLIDLGHATKIDAVSRAISALGRRLELAVA
jgi:antitoxin HicB